jgi:Ca2+-binding RTX toxin-like protein
LQHECCDGSGGVDSPPWIPSLQILNQCIRSSEFGRTMSAQSSAAMRRRSQARFRRFLVESLEAREMLATDMLQTRTGDVLEISLEPASPASQWNGATLSGLAGSPLLQARSDSSGLFDLTDGNAEVGQLLWSPQAGKAWFAPNTLSHVASDTDPIAPGWQGQLTFQFVVDGTPRNVEVNVLGGASSIPLAGDVRSVQQRLNYLGYWGGKSSPLALSGSLDSETALALQQFKATVDSSGERLPIQEAATTENPLLDERTLRWLRDPQAPRWIELSRVGSSTTPSDRPYVSSWVFESLRAVKPNPVDPNTTIPFVHTASANSPTAGPLGVQAWNSHLAGMDVKINLATLAGSNVSRAAELVAWGNLPDAANRARVAAFRTSNSGLHTAYLSAPGARPELIHLVAASALPGTILHVDFKPPWLPQLEGNEESAMREQAEQLADRFKLSRDFPELTTPLPILGTTDRELPPRLIESEAEFFARQVTLARLSKVDEKFDTVIRSVHDYLSAPTYSGIPALATYLASLAHVGVSQVVWTETEERVEFQIQLSTSEESTHDLHLGNDARSRDVAAAPELDDQFNVTTTLESTFTIGLNRRALEMDLHIASLEIEAAASVERDPNGISALNFPIEIGLLDSDVAGGTLAFQAKTLFAMQPGAGRIRLSELANSGALPLVLSMTPSGSAVVELPVSEEFLGQPRSNLVLTQSNVFAGDPQLHFGNSCVQQWTNHGTELLRGYVQFVENALGDLARSSLMNARGGFDIPTVGQAPTSLNDLVPLVQMWRHYTSALYDVSGNFLATSIQDLLAGLNGAIANYDPNNCTITVGFDIEETFTRTENFHVGVPLGELSNLKTNSDFEVEATGRIAFNVGLDLAPLGNSFALNPTTLVRDLNGGKNPLLLNVEGQTDLLITLANGDSFEVNFDGLDAETTTVAELIARIESSVARGPNNEKRLVVDIDTRLKRLIVEDRSGGLINDFKIVGANGSAIGGPQGLGIWGETGAMEPDGVYRLRGTALHGADLRDHVFIDASTQEIPGITLSANINATNLQASADFAFVGVGIQNGTLTLQSQVDVGFKDPNGDNRITMTEFLSGLKAHDQPGSILRPFEKSLSGELRLPTEATFNGQSMFEAGGGQAPAIVVSWPSYDVAPEVDYEGDFTGLTNFIHMSLDRLCDGVIGVLERFNQSAIMPIQDTLGFGFNNSDSEGIKSLLDELKKTKKGGLQDVATWLNNAFTKVFGPGSSASGEGEGGGSGMGAGEGEGPVPYAVVNRPNANELKIALNLPKQFARQAQRLNLDLESLGLGELGRLAQIGGAGVIGVDANMTLKLDLGFEMRAPGAPAPHPIPRPFLYDSTRFDVQMRAEASDIDLRTTVLGVGVEARNGTLVLDRDGAGPSTAPALLSIGFENATGEGKRYFDSNIFEGLSILSADAGYELVLPIHRLPDGAVLDISTPELIIRSDNVADFSNSTTVIAPDFRGLADNIDLSRYFSGMSEGINGLFSLLDAAVDGVAFASKLPIVGDQLKEAADLITRVRDETKSRLEQAGTQTLKFVRDQLFDALGTRGLNMLGDNPQPNAIAVFVDGVAFNPDGQVLNHVPNEVLFEMVLMQALVKSEVDLDFDIGLPLLGLELDGGIHLQVAGTFELGFGLSRSDGFFIDTSAQDELQFQAIVTLPDFQATGTLGFLEVTATDHAAAPSVVGGTFFVDLKGGPDGRLTMAELGSLNHSDMVSARFEGGANIHLDLRTSFGGNLALPSLASEFILEWEMNTADTRAFPNEPLIGFVNTYLDAGGAINGIVAPFLREAGDVLRPIAAVLDVITTPIPLLSELLGDGFTLLRILKLAAEVFTGPRSLDAPEGVIRAVDKVLDLLKHVNASGEIQIRVEDFWITEARQASLSSSTPKTRSGSTINLDGLTYLLGDGVNSVLNGVKSAMSIIGGDAFPPPKFPIIEKPATAIGLLLGKDVDIITWQMPEFDVWVPVYQPAPLAALKGSYTLEGRVGLGMDTKGLRQFAESGDAEDIFNGFYIKSNIDNGIDKPEFAFNIDLLAAAGLISPPIPKFSPIQFQVDIGAGGAFQGNISVNLIDPNQDGKVHWDELYQNASRGFGCAFDIQGGFEASLKAFAKVKGSIDVGLFSKEIVLLDEEKDFTSFDWGFETSCSSSVPENDALRPASLRNGVLELNTNDESETFTIEPLGEAGSMRVTRTRGTSTIRFDYSEVTSIIGEGRGGDDQIFIMSGITVPATLRGGQGNDVLSGGDGENKLYGDEGDDVLIGGNANDLLDGGIGNDKLYGNGGDDDLRGGDGDDELHGGTGNDRLRGGDGNDRLHGDDGDDVLEGGSGDDRLFGGSGADRLIGGLGNDSLDGGSDNDVLIAGLGESGSESGTINILIGGAGDDLIYGDRGDDRIWGDDVGFVHAGNDTIFANDGNNIVYGGAGNDRITTGRGRDIIYAGDGDDTIDAGDGNDEIYGGAGNDRIIAGRGDDLVYGEDGDDVIDGGQGSDRIYGGDGNDWIKAGVAVGLDAVRGDIGARNFVDGGDGDDVIFGDFGNDTIYGGRGNDYIVAYAGNDWIDGGDGNDTIYGGPGSDRIAGGLGNDTIYAGSGPNGGGSTRDVNVVFGDLMDTYDDVEAGPRSGHVNADTIYGDVGNDTIYGNTGDDTIFGVAGNNTIYAGWGSDTVYAATLGGGTNPNARNWIAADPEFSETVDTTGQAHHDTVYGSIGHDTIFTYVGNDVVIAYSGVDEIHVGSGDDVVRGGDGNKRVFAGEGNDTIELGNGNNFVDAGAGNDRIVTGSGNDVVFAGAGNDFVSAGAGDDFVVGGSGDDVIHGGDGRDVLWGGEAAIAPEAFLRDQADFFTYPTNFPGANHSETFGMARNVPVFLAGLSLNGRVTDGRNSIYGDDGDDWIWGGGLADQLYGGLGDDYIDGGAGNDTIYGGAGNDVIRGGANDDLLYGDEGIDRVFGDSGNDRLFGGPGIGSGATQDLTGQRLFGGDGNDYLYGFSFSASFSTPESRAQLLAEARLDGGELHGGAGNDWIFGSIRSELITGGDGNDTVLADGVWGPSYVTNPFMAYVGGDDVVYGDGGQDKLFGGGGDDELWGGADSDWLEGQGGSDTLYGGSGIDTLVLDTDAEYANPLYAGFSLGEPEVFDGHYRNAPEENTPDDNATDILLIEGTHGDDRIFIGQMIYEPAPSIENDPRLHTRMVVEYNERVMLVDWRSFDSLSDLNGLPLVEQFRISGLVGNDHIEFLRKSRKVSINGVEIDVMPLDVSDLTERSNDWVGVIDGGPGDDTLIGTDARDRIDGGRGKDTIFGYGGNDQLWGDGGPGQGDPGDHDILYAGTGNDDLLGGQGTNELYAWSFDPDQGTFGVYVDELGSYFDENGTPFADDGDADGDGRLDSDPTRPARKLEDTGLNRMLGGKNTDLLYGGTGLDFMYGNGAPENAPDKLHSRTGELFEAADAGLAGEEWKKYAQSTDKVWYYSGSNLDDVIHVDFVTEPGLLQGHHLITRLTENTGNFTFDAQVRLDFKATDANGNLAWNPNDSFYGQTLVGTVTLPQNGQLSSDLSFSLLIDGVIVPVQVAATGTNTSRRDLVESIQAALAGTAAAGIVDARLSGEVLSLVRVDGVAGKQAPLEVFSSSSVAQAELGLLPGQVSTNAFGGSFGLGSLLPPEDAFLAIIVDALDGDDHIIVGPTVIKSVWSDGGRGNDIIEHLSGTPILIDQTDYRTDGVGNGSKETAHSFGFIASSASGAVRGGQLMTGLTIDSPTDIDWYRFKLGDAYTGAGTLELRSLSKYDGMTMRLNVPQPNDDPPVIRQATGENPFSVSLADLQPNTEYFIEIRSNLNPTVYELEFVVGDSSNTTLEQAVGLDLPLDGYRAILGRPMRFTGDEAWYQFQVSAETESDASLVLHQLSGSGTLTVRLMNSTGQAIRSATSTGGSDAALSLRGLVSDQEYYLNITGSSAGDYELIPKFGGSQIVDLSARTIRDFSDPLLKNIDRRDVLLGGDGNDILRGGSGEDWIFGGAGNDVLSGGNDRQAPDLLWGGSGDDIFQVIPDALPVLRSRPRSFDPDNEQTVLTTLTDRFDGGEGNDQVLFLGGDLDAAGNPIDDFVTMRWNTILHRYELATRVWDTATRSHVTLTQPTAAEYVGNLPNFETQPLLKFGRLPLGPEAQPLVIRLMVNAGEEHVLTITPESTRNNNRFEDLVLQLNAALEEAGLGGELTAVARNGRLAFRTVQTGIGARIDIQAPQGNEADLFTATGLRATGTTPATGGSNAADYQYHYAFYTTLDTEHTVIDTQAGDDEVRADAEFTIAGSQWGFGTDVRPQRGNPNLIIRGGAGNDRLFGGAGTTSSKGVMGTMCLVAVVAMISYAVARATTIWLAIPTLVHRIVMSI